MNILGPKILIADDEEDIRLLLEFHLKKEGYQVFKAENGKECVEIAHLHQPDLILLDVMMPLMDGVQVCNQLRSFSKFESTIITFLSARTEDYSKIAGFKAGADAYISKPIRIRVLLEEIKALLNRGNKIQLEKNVIEQGDFKIELDKHLVYFKSKPIELPKLEFNLISFFAINSEKVLTREQLYYQVWGGDMAYGDRTIDVYVRKLRKRFGQDCIKSIKGVGYKFL